MPRRILEQAERVVRVVAALLHDMAANILREVRNLARAVLNITR